MVDAESVARSILAALQAAVAAKDGGAVAALFADDVVLFGTGAENFGSEQTGAYLERVLAQPGTLRWAWQRVVPLWDSPQLLAFAVTGTVGFDTPAGQPTEARDDFRLTCVAVRQDGRWRLRHFHGSVRQAG